MWDNLLKKLYASELISKEELEKVKGLVAEYYRIPKEILNKIKVKFSSLPTFYACWITKVGNYLKVLYLPIAKILGLYDPEKKEIYVEKNVSKAGKLKTLIHEYIHAAQDYLGKIYNKSREELEREAHMVADYLFKIYNQGSRKLSSSLRYLTPV